MLDEEIRQILDYVRGWKLSPDRKGLEAAFERLTKIGSPAVPALLDLFKNPPQEPYVLWHASIALEEIADKRAIPVLLTSLYVLENLPGELSWDVRYHVSRALGKLGPDSVPTLVKMFLGSDLTLHHLSLEALGPIGVASIHAIMPYLNTDERLLRARALIGSIDDPEAFDIMCDLLVHLAIDIRYAAAYGLQHIESRIQDGRAKKALLVGLRDPEEWVRGNVIRRLSELVQSGDLLEPEYVAALDDPVARIACIAQEILEKIGTPEALQALTKSREGRPL